jgi:hypothetical protein
VRPKRQLVKFLIFPPACRSKFVLFFYLIKLNNSLKLKFRPAIFYGNFLDNAESAKECFNKGLCDTTQNFTVKTCTRLLVLLAFPVMRWEDIL